MISHKMNVGVHLEMEHSKRLENRWYIIYRITNLFDSDSYIGCTSNTITHRFNQHVYNSKRLDHKLARKIRDIGRENMMIVDLYSRWMNQVDAQEVEGGLIDLLEPTLNVRSSGKFYDMEGNYDEKEYRSKNKEHKREYDKEYRSKNKDKLSEKVQCECGGSFTYPNKTAHQRTRKHMSNTSVFSPPPCGPDVSPLHSD